MPMQYLEGQVNGHGTGRPVRPLKSPAPCLEGQLECVGNGNFSSSSSKTTLNLKLQH